MKKLTLPTTACILLCAMVMQGQVVNFDVPGGIGGVNYSGQGAYSDSVNNPYWNPIAPNGTTSASTLWSDGVTVSPITFTEQQTAIGADSSGAPGTPQGLEYLYAVAGTALSNSVETCTLNNVPAGTYNLYLYGKDDDNDDADRGTTFTVNVGATNYGSLSTTNYYDTGFTLYNDYVVFNDVVVPSAGTITFTYTANPNANSNHDPNDEGDFNGLQLVVAVLATNLATVTNSSATGISATAATLGGSVLTNGGSVVTVTTYYGTTDGGTNAGAWANSVSQSVTTGAFSQMASNLSPATVYYFTSSAANAVGTAWATPSQSFTTPAALATVTNSSATGVQATSATLGGGVVSTGGSVPVVTIYYGISNGGTNAAAWANSVSLGSVAGGSTFNQTVSNLSSGIIYYFTAAAANGAGTAWATPSQLFATLNTNIVSLTNPFTSDLSTNSWRLWLDTSASWQSDKIYLPGQFALSSLPVNQPTGGWGVLSATQGIPVTLPNTVEGYYWNTYNGGYDGVSWWWSKFTAPTLTAGQRLVLQFRSARLRAEVYCNGKLCAYNIITEIPFEADVTSAIVQGATTNVLAVRITNPGGTYSWGDYNTFQWGTTTNAMPISHGFGGLDESINMIVLDPIAVHDLAVLNHPNPQEVWLVSTLTNSGTTAYNGPLELNILSNNSLIMWQGSNTVSVPAGGQAVYTNDVVVSNATLWSLTNPVLYTASAAIPGYSASGSGATFGFRWFAPAGIFTNAYFALNGNRIVLRSAISWGYWPVNGLYPSDFFARKEVQSAKTLGLNCLNFHRNMGHPNVLDQQDQLGLLRYQEPGTGVQIFPSNNINNGNVVKPTATNMTGTGGAPVTFVQQYEVDKILAMVRRDRSHPSLVIYCDNNENTPTLTNPAAFYLLDQMRQIDPSRTLVLHSGGGPQNEVVSLPYTSGTNFLVENGSGGIPDSGYNDSHNEGGPGTYQDDLYLSANNYGLFSSDNTEIVDWGEMYGVGMPDDHEAIVNWYQTNGVFSTGYDLAVHQQALAPYEAFLAQWNFNSAYTNASALYYQIGMKSYFFWQKLMEDGRMCDANDYLTISGWESTSTDNNSALVDVLRDFRTDPTVLSRSMSPEVLVIRSKRLVVKPGNTASVDVFLINETGRSGAQTLTITAVNPNGSTLFTRQSSVNVGGSVNGKTVFGSVLASNLTFAPTTNGTVLINGTLQPNGGTGDVLTNQVQLLVIDPTAGTPLFSQVAVVEGSNQITSTLSSVFGVNALGGSNLSAPLNAIVMSPSANYNWPFSSTSTGASIANTSNPGLFQNQMYGSAGNIGYWYGFAPGNITVQLDFAEIYFNSAGSRVFDVAINGTTVLPNFDIYATAGGENIAVVETFTNNSTNGSILLSFPKVEANNAQIAAIKITDSTGKVMAACFNTASFTDNTGLTWQPYQNTLAPINEITSAQWQTALNQVYSNGVRLVLWPNGVSEALLFANMLAASNIVSIANINGNDGFLGQANASWLGSWYFSRQHWLLNGLPVNSVLNWQYQVPHLNAGSVSDVGALLLDPTPAYPMEVMIGYGRDHEPIVGMGGCDIQYGQGVIVLPSLPGLRDALVATNAEITQPVAQMILGNALRSILSSVPSAPTDLTAAPGNAQVTLSWYPAFDGTNYTVQRSTVSGGPYTTIASNVTALSYQDVGLNDNTTYYYVVAAVNPAGVGPNSAEASATPEVWPGLDIGAAGAAGSTSQSGNTITMNGAGADIYNTADAFQFAYQLISGNCDVRALVASVENINVWSKAGVMIRQSLNASDANIAMVITPGMGAEMQYRTNFGGNTSETSTGGITAPYWVRLTRTNNTFICYMMPTNGTSWTQLGSTQTIPMTTNVYVGLALTSHDAGVLCTATFQDVSIVSLPSPWQTEDIGVVGVTGSAFYPNGIFTLLGSGADIYNTSDAFRYVYLIGSGDCDISAQVLTVEDTDPWAKAGVMIRQTLNANDVNVATVVTPGNGVSFQYRTNAGGNSAETSSGGITAPYWVRAIRTGNTFAGYMSPDGINWTQQGTTQTITMTTNGYYIGLPVTSHNVNYICDATFANVVISTNVNSGNSGTSSPVNLTLTTTASGNLVLQWPYHGNLSGVSLYYTPSLTPPIAWTLVTNSLILSSNQWSVTLPENTSTNAGFYELSPSN